VTNAIVSATYSQDLGLDPWVGFFVGFFGTVAWLAFWLASPRRFERELDHLAALLERKKLTPERYQQLLELAVAWYGARRFGGPLPPVPTSPRRQTAKKA
jgi:hypothetical protein